MKLAHRLSIASPMNKLISTPILLSMLSILLKPIERIGAEYPKHRPDKHVHKGQGAAVWQLNLYYIKGQGAAIWQINLIYIILST